MDERALANLHGLLDQLVGEDVDLVVEREADDSIVEANASYLDQIVMNLVVNAREALPDGGRITVSTGVVEATAPPVGVEPGPYVFVAVQDTGVGMSEETESKLFEPFFTTKDTGTGLGLATVHALVTQLGGWIDVDTAVGEGTTFTVHLPKAPRPVPAKPETPSDRPLGQGETVLLVDDDALVRQTVAYYLERLGYAPLVAANAEEALELCDAHGGLIEAVLVDIVLPGLSGPDLADEIRRRHPGSSGLLMSGFSTEELVEQRRITAGVETLDKPFTEYELARRLRAALDG